MSHDRIAVVLKVGDKQTAAGKEHFGLKEGMIVSMIEESAYGDTLENIISDHMKKVYAVVEVKKSLRSKVLELMKPVGIDTETNEIKNIDKFRPRKAVLPLSDLEKKDGHWKTCKRSQRR